MGKVYKVVLKTIILICMFVFFANYVTITLLLNILIVLCTIKRKMETYRTVQYGNTQIWVQVTVHRKLENLLF